MTGRWVLCALLAFVAFPATAARHVRVVLDLSKSMQTNDPGRLAILSTILLHDLAQPNTSLGDSFDVIPFDLNWQWRDPAAPPPASTQPHIKAQGGRRAEFVQAVSALPYAANMTYFYPGIAAALGDLEQIRVGAQDVRTIVLITDGLPEPQTRDPELQRIRDELGPRLEKQGIRLYVLAFGGVADQNRAFFSAMVESRQGASLGGFFVDPQGRELLSYMLEIFSRTFGFSPDAARQLSGPTTLDLQAGVTPERVAVAILSARPQPPQLHLTPPPGGSVNAPQGVQSAGVGAGSYSLAWVYSPDPGDYGLVSDVAQGSVAVLRPTRLALEILTPQGKNAQRALADTPLQLQVLVRPATGAAGDPGPVDLSFRTLGERLSTGTYSWTGEFRAPPSGSGTPTSQGRIYDIVAAFEEDKEEPAKMYAGYLEVTARRGEAVVGALVEDRAHRVEVHPRLSLSPLPLSAYASSNALARREQACTQFSFHLNAGHLPHPDRPSYPVRMVLVPGNPAAVDRELNQASFTLDGLPLEFEGKPGSQAGAWYKGRALAPAELLGNHQICVRIGKPTAGDPSRPVELTVAATLQEVPYDEFRVVQPFTLKVLVSPPTFLERWRLVLLAVGVLLAVSALLWYFRDRPAFPADLGYAVGREDSSAPLSPHALDERSPLARLLGRAGESVVIAPGEDRALGRIHPVDDQLFQLRPAEDVRIESIENGEVIPLHRGMATLAVHRTYRLRSSRGSYLFRMEYR